MTEDICTQDGPNSWTCYQADSRSIAADVRSGFTEKPTQSCQYWVSGLPAICTKWDAAKNKCNVDLSTAAGKPSGYGNGGICDSLGRQPWCSQYAASEEGTDKFVCIAPCLARSGLQKRVLVRHPKEPDVIISSYYTPVIKSEILGYNEREVSKGIVGACDGFGMGRGKPGFDSPGEREKLPIKCNYYRPYSMGFGASEPQEILRNTEGKIDLEAMKAAVSTTVLKTRLPYHFKIFNIRAKIKKCAYWAQDFGTDFYVDPTDMIIRLTGEPFSDNKVTHCECPDSASDPYRTRTLALDMQPILSEVWSKDASGVICNGAKPECPCYTGEWRYLTDRKMQPGKRISAEQIMELRFWMDDWESQEQYNKFFEELPGTDPDNITTADIYSFTKWEKFSAYVPEESIMRGVKTQLCVPASPVNKEFEPTSYLKVSELIYPKFAVRKGTSTEKIPISFPTLIRDISEFDPKPLTILFPFKTKDPFSLSYGCNASDMSREPPFCKVSSSIDDDFITVIGATIRHKSVFILNTTIVNDFFIFLNKFNSVNDIDLFDRNAIYNSIASSLTSLENSSNPFQKIVSDNYGLFTFSEVPLKYGALNKLLVIVAYDDGTYNFKRVSVWSQWSAGIVAQTSYTCNRLSAAGDIILDFGDTLITPAAEATCKGIPLKTPNSYKLTSSINKITPIVSEEVTNIYGTSYLYSYCVKKHIARDVALIDWMRVESYGIILCKIPEVNLNYFYDWDVTKATITIPRRDDTDPKRPEEKVEMEVLYPNDSIFRNTLLRDIIILKPKDGKLRYIPSDSELIITYYYEYLALDKSTSDDEEIVWPVFDDSTTKFVSPTLTVEQEEEEKAFKITNIVKNTVSVLGEFVDEEGALISQFATRMLVEIPNIKCRSVEAYYRWNSSGSMYQLQPARGFVEALKPPSYLRADNKVNVPFCGDHDLLNAMQTGPMWFPFNSCLTYHFYDVKTSTNYCTLPHEGIRRNDYRGCGPDKSYAYTLGEAGVSTCVLKFEYAYSEIAEPIFTGYANVVPYVNPILYEMMGWDLPPFGNVSREYFEKFLSDEYMYYPSVGSQGLTYKAAWMPKVPSNSEFHFDFNAFPQGEYTNIKFVSQLSLFKKASLSEFLSFGERTSFDDTFEARIERRAQYPSPLKEDDRGMFCAFYDFKDEAALWAWQEYWTPVSRASFDKFAFTEIERPAYLDDMYGKEHRFIPEEEFYTVYFTAPEIKGNGVLATLPSLRLGEGPARHFQIEYDSYDSSLIGWADENEGEVDGSGGTSEKDEENPYSLTRDRELWIHSDDTLFDDTYTTSESKAKDLEREMILGYDPNDDTWLKVYYNTGLEFLITKDKLSLLPVTKTPVTPTKLSSLNDQMPEDPFGKDYDKLNLFWFNKTESDLVVEVEKPGCLTGIEIKGWWGGLEDVSTTTKKAKTIEMCKPGVTVLTWYGGQLCKTKVERAKKKLVRESKFEEFTIELEFTAAPDRMISDNYADFIVRFENPENCFLFIYKVTPLFSKYRDSQEQIRVWERKYNVSYGSVGDYNLNGPQKPLTPRFGSEGGGIYWPWWGDTDKTDLRAENKMRSIGAGEYFPDKEDLKWADISDERNRQLELYESAQAKDASLGNSYFHFYLPPKLQTFLERHDLDARAVANVGVSLTIRSSAVPIDKEMSFVSYEEIEPWQPLGHTFTWGGSITRWRCLWFDRLRTIYEPEFVHLHIEGSGAYEQVAHPFDIFYGAVRNKYMEGKRIQNDALKIKGEFAWPADKMNYGGSAEVEVPGGA